MQILEDYYSVEECDLKIWADVGESFGSLQQAIDYIVNYGDKNRKHRIIHVMKKVVQEIPTMNRP